MFTQRDEKIRKQKVEVGLLALCAFIYRQTRRGVDKLTISQMLAVAGMSPADATEFVEKVQVETALLGRDKNSPTV